ncbi:PLC-like phosphodiesterase [Anaeromyces robustus]|uniref:PLC-like phosphodiesterase n=1 Tax=Anaeromyces robustus TaxID=1754192 RepID=A0A1Y1XL30_9FUNG|nr:PLC-like phosphodiesterase [Anaeromyces robustus]|eukprot:ORX86468.1 PLC-like phosphodiesterase [Anaeromyces robustus]
MIVNKNILFYTLISSFFILFTKAQIYCNGYESYCNRGYDELTYATSHNSFAIGKSYSANQEKGVDQQLADGIRGLMLDTHINEQDGGVHFCHNKCDNSVYLDAGPAVDILSVITNFIQQNPYEVITIFIENNNVPVSMLNEVFTNSGLVNYAYIPTYDGSWPTLGEMISNQKNVVIFGDQMADDPSYPWYLSWDRYVQYTNYVSLQNEDWNCNVMGGYGSLFLLYHMKHVQVLNSGYLPDTTIIDKTNSISGINAQTQYCPNRINFIAVDYYNHGDILEFVTRLNNEDYSSMRTSDGQSLKLSKSLGLITLLLIIIIF